MGLNVNIEVLIPHNKVCSKVGYPVPIWHRYLLALFHCMVRHGTVRYGSLLGGFPLGTVPGT